MKTVSTVASPSSPVDTVYLFGDESIDSFLFAIALDSILFLLLVTLFFIEFPNVLTRTWYFLALDSLVMIIIAIACRLIQFNFYLNVVVVSIASKIVIFFFSLYLDEENIYRGFFLRLGAGSSVLLFFVILWGLLRWLEVIPGIPGLEFAGLGIYSRSMTFGGLIDIVFTNTRFNFGTLVIFALLAILAFLSVYNTVNDHYTSYHYLNGRSRPTGWIGLSMFFGILLVSGIAGLSFQLLSERSYVLLVILLCCGVTAMVSSANFSNSNKHPFYSFLTAFSTTLVLLSIFNFLTGRDQIFFALLSVFLPYFALNFIFLEVDTKPLIRNY